MSTHEFYEIARMAVARALAVDLACLLMDRSRVRFAETRCRLSKRIQNGLQIEGRAADDLEHIGGGGLLLQRFAQLVKQARVLDGDDGLIGEVCDQLDLLLGEWPNFSPIDCNAADRLILSEHRHGDQCADAGDFDAVDRQWIAVEVSSTLCKVRNVDRPSGLSGANVRDVLAE